MVGSVDEIFSLHSNIFLIKLFCLPEAVSIMITNHGKVLIWYLIESHLTVYTTTITRVLDFRAFIWYLIESHLTVYTTTITRVLDFRALRTAPGFASKSQLQQYHDISPWEGAHMVSY